MCVWFSYFTELQPLLLLSAPPFLLSYRLSPATPLNSYIARFDPTNHLSLQPSTRHTLSSAEFQKMKRGIVIVNTARGAVMDEAALVDALNSGIVSSVGLDVFESEPEIHPGLVDNEKVLLLPHMGTYTQETQAAMESVVVRNVRSALLERRLVTRVGEQEGMGYGS